MEHQRETRTSVSHSPMPKMDFRRHASIAYISAMSADNGLAIGSVEHYTILLLRNFYPTAYKSAKMNKLRVAKLATVRRLKKEYGTDVFPEQVWKEIRRGLRRMSNALNSSGAFESALYGYPIPDTLLHDAVDRLLVLPDTQATHAEPLGIAA